MRVKCTNKDMKQIKIQQKITERYEIRHHISIISPFVKNAIFRYKNGSRTIPFPDKSFLCNEKDQIMFCDMQTCDN